MQLNVTHFVAFTLALCEGVQYGGVVRESLFLSGQRRERHNVAATAGNDQRCHTAAATA
jgi:hypothetical protein